MHTVPVTTARASLAATLGFGFRPFFLLAAVAAVLLPAGWLALLAGWRWPGAPAAPLDWHAHEMVFGFAAAAMAGFLLTAVPGFTRRPPVTGLPLGLLALAWLSARLAGMFSSALPATLPMLADSGFLAAIAVLTARDVIAAGNRRNLVLVALAVLMALASLVDHLGLTAPTRVPGLHVLLVLLTVLGGRVVPSFSANWLRAQGSEMLPRSRTVPDVATLVLTVLAGSLHLWGGSRVSLAVVAGLAALAHAVRLAGWRGLATRREPLVFVLHVGYAWLPVGYLLLACAAAGVVPHAAPIHAFGLGAVGTMVLAIMTRASLGHTGRPLRAPRAAVLAYWMVSLAALTRVAATLWPPAWTVLVPVSGVAWMAAFALFLVAYLPMLVRPRLA